MKRVTSHFSQSSPHLPSAHGFGTQPSTPPGHPVLGRPPGPPGPGIVNWMAETVDRTVRAAIVRSLLSILTFDFFSLIITNKLQEST